VELDHPVDLLERRNRGRINDGELTTTLLRGVALACVLLGLAGAVSLGKGEADWLLIASYVLAGVISAALFAGLAGILRNLERLARRLALMPTEPKRESFE